MARLHRDCGMTQAKSAGSLVVDPQPEDQGEHEVQGGEANSTSLQVKSDGTDHSLQDLQTASRAMLKYITYIEGSLSTKRRCAGCQMST